MQINIQLDDQDRDQAPEKPWAATVQQGDYDFGSSGIGATKAEALRDLADEIERDEEPDKQAETPEVYVLVIEHEHGNDATVARSRETALDVLHRFVVLWWDDERERGGNTIEGDLPTDKDEAITAYFHENEREHYTLTPTLLLP